METHIQTKMMLHQKYYQTKFNCGGINREKGGFLKEIITSSNTR